MHCTPNCIQYPHFFIRMGGGRGTGSTRQSATEYLLYLPRMIVMMMENLVEWRLAGETEVLGENLPQRYFFHHKSHLPDPSSNMGSRGGKPATNRLSYGAAYSTP
jgi:hypothetical protein